MMARLEREREPLDAYMTAAGADAPAVTGPDARDAGPWGRCVCGENVLIADAREITPLQPSEIGRCERTAKPTLPRRGPALYTDLSGGDLA